MAGTVRRPGGHDLRIVLKLANDDKGKLSATLYEPYADGWHVSAL